MRLGLSRGIRLRILPAYTKPRWQRMFGRFIIILALAALVAGITQFYIRVRPLISSLAEVRASLLATAAMNEAINEHMVKNNIEYDDLIIMQQLPDGHITALATNIAATNKLKSELAISIQKKISAIESTDIKIPLGSLLGFELLEGAGPRIPIRLVPSGYASVDFVSSFDAAGINQTRHEISVKIVTEMGMILPAGLKNVSVSTHVPVAETIIVGEIPQTYLDIR